MRRPALGAGRDDPAVAVVDGPAFGVAFLAALGAVSRRVLLDDDAANRPAYPVGFVLNQYAHADRAAYPSEPRRGSCGPVVRDAPPRIPPGPDAASIPSGRAAFSSRSAAPILPG